jgi:hypothetical protein
LYTLAAKSGVLFVTISRIEQGHLSPIVAPLEKRRWDWASLSVTSSPWSARRHGGADPVRAHAGPRPSAAGGDFKTAATEEHKATRAEMRDARKAGRECCPRLVQRERPVLFDQIADDYMEYSERSKRSYRDDQSRKASPPRQGRRGPLGGP